MRKTIVAAVAALSIAGVGGGALIAQAQPAAPPPPQEQPMPPPGPGFGGPPGPHHFGEWRHEGWRHHHWRKGGHGLMGGPRTFALVYPHRDRNLSPSDVKTIAEAFLLWNGNHTWKVVDVGQHKNGKIGFAYATANGAVVAHFTMDPHTGRLHRVN